MPDNQDAISVADSTRRMHTDNTSLKRTLRHASKCLCLGAAMALALGAAATTASAKETAKDMGKSTYNIDCVACHGKDGVSTATGKSLKAPDLRSEAVQKMTDKQIMEQIENGKNNMPPFKNTLNKTQIKALVVYVRTFGKKKGK